jgi:hypothetical protein
MSPLFSEVRNQQQSCSQFRPCFVFVFTEQWEINFENVFFHLIWELLLLIQSVNKETKDDKKDGQLMKGRSEAFVQLDHIVVLMLTMEVAIATHGVAVRFETKIMSLLR